MLLDNIYITIVLEHCIWTEPFFWAFSEDSPTLFSLQGGHFKLSSQSSKALLLSLWGGGAKWSLEGKRWTGLVYWLVGWEGFSLKPSFLGTTDTFPCPLQLVALAIPKEETRIEWAYCAEDFKDIFKANLFRSHILSPEAKWFYLLKNPIKFYNIKLDVRKP